MGHDESISDVQDVFVFPARLPTKNKIREREILNKR